MTAKYCMICGLEVREVQDVSATWEWDINGAVIGERIDLKGHKICLENLNNLVVIPNRLRLMEEIKKMKEEVGQPLQAKEKDIMEFLETLENKLQADLGQD
jgi:hypothetical protein